jgi:hypothetical protein
VAEGFVAEHPLELEAARGWIGNRVDGIASASVGRVEGVFADAESRAPVWLVIRIGRLGRRTAVPFSYAAPGAGGHVWVPYPKATLREAPEVDPAVGARPELERELCDHYGLAPGHARRSQLDGRDPAELSCLPA